jgi:S-adenosylmethionine uptake transporter
MPPRRRPEENVMTARSLFAPVLRLRGLPRSTLLAAALMIGAGALFALQAALVKVGLEHAAPLEIVFFRGAVCAVLVLAFARTRGLSLGSSRPAGQLAFGVTGCISLALYFGAIGELPLVTATALNYTAPLFLALFAAIPARRLPASVPWVATGFAGVCAVLEPSLSAGSARGMILALGSGLTGAVAYLLLSRLGRSGEPNRVTAFWFSLVVCALSGLATLRDGFSVASWHQAGVLIAMGLLAAVAQLAVFKAYALSTPLIPATLSYSAVVFSSLAGALWWGESLGVWSAFGIALIVASGVLVSASPEAPGAADEAALGRRRVGWLNLRSLYAAGMLARRPDQVKYVFMMGNAQDELAEGLRARGEMPDPFRASPQLEALWQRRFHPAPYRVEDLLALPPHTLGGAYARLMKARGLRPDFYDKVDARHRTHYLRLRVRQTHDIWHVVAGFDTDVTGEVGLQGFYFAQWANGQCALILAGLMARCIVRGRLGDLDLLIEAFCEGYRNGRRAKSLLAVEWEALWQEPLDEVRRRFAVEPAACRAGRLPAAIAGAS